MEKWVSQAIADRALRCPKCIRGRIIASKFFKEIRQYYTVNGQDHIGVDFQITLVCGDCGRETRVNSNEFKRLLPKKGLR